jgi:hypothetical protein
MFVQVIDFETDSIDEGQRYVDEYREKTAGRRAVRRALLLQDRDRPGHYLNVVFFDDFESAMKNSEMPETQELSAQLMKLGKGEPTFYNLDVIRDED